MTEFLTYREALQSILDGKDFIATYEVPIRLSKITQADLDQRSPYRLKPRTVTINGVEVPAPMRVAPEMGAEYFVLYLTKSGLSDELFWANDAFDHKCLARGLCYRTREEAEAVAKALIAALGGIV